MYPAIIKATDSRNGTLGVAPFGLLGKEIKYSTFNTEEDQFGRKRGSDELLAQTTALTNGSAMCPQPNGDMNNDAKKVKLDKNMSGSKPSRVVHLRNIPPDATESEIIHLGVPFGKVSNILMLKGKSQAFLELQEESSATTMVTYFQSTPPSIRGRQIFIQYSNHKELKTENMPAAAMNASHHALQAALNAAGGQGVLAPQNAAAQAALQAASALMSDTAGGPNCVLRVIVEHMVYPVTIDVLYQIFSRFGRVLKIITFTKNNLFQALIQFPDSQQSTQAKLALDGQNIYNACCTLRIDFSKLTNLNVKYNNEKSRDFTNPTLGSGDPAIDQAMAMGMPAAAAAAQYSGLPAAAQLQHLGAAAGIAGVRLPGLSAGSPVVLVSNLNEEMVTPDSLFTLFGVYGDVHRVKILFNKKDNALIQFADPAQAQLALQHLDKVKVMGKQIRVALSKHMSVQMPREGQPDAGLTKDFQNSPLHRFKKPGSKNYQNIFAPSSTLHLSNIPAIVTEDDLKELFNRFGAVVAFKFFAKDRKMALIQMTSVDEAIMSLISMHNYQLADNQHLRVSFSKSTI